jgi:hypothetical protein
LQAQESVLRIYVQELPQRRLLCWNGQNSINNVAAASEKGDNVNNLRRGYQLSKLMDELVNSMLPVEQWNYMRIRSAAQQKAPSFRK